MALPPAGIAAEPLTVAEVTQTLVRVRTYLEAETPPRLEGDKLATGAFNLAAYQWGMVYAGMLRAAETTGDAAFREHADTRLKFIAREAPRQRELPVFRPFNQPRSLDDAGPMAMALLKAQRAGIGGELKPLLEPLVAWIRTGQARLADGTLARNRPQPHTLWLDDLYMSVPALALADEHDEAVKQVTQFAARLFDRERGLWSHGWVAGRATQPMLRWARANGWALMAMSELLDVLPENHPGRAAVLEIYRAQVRGIVACQDRDGRWHQLLDRPETYLETSASAMLTFGLARGVLRGWVAPKQHAPVATRAWRGVASQVNRQGQVENVCIGTGVDFTPEFYATRPVSATAPHGPGTVLLAGAEMVALAKQFP